MTEPFFHVKKIGERYETSGDASRFFGHRLPSTVYERPDGIYAEWHWDGQRLIVSNDRYGFYPLFYFAVQDEIAVSTSIAALIAAGAPTDFDEAGLAVFLRLGHFLGDDTPFKAIRLLPPDASFEWRDGRLEVSGKVPSIKPQQLKRDEVIDTYILLFRRAIERRLPDGPCAVPISGGRDSRHILLELCASGHPPDVCTTVRHYPPRSDSDAEVASMLAAALEVKHVVLEQSDSRLRAEVRKNLLTHFCSLEHGWVMVMADYLRGKANTVYDGVAGDVLSAGHFLDERRLAFYEAGDSAGLAEYLFSIEDSVSDTALKSLLTAEQYQKLGYELAAHHLTKEIEKHLHAPNPVASFFFWNRTRRVAAISPYGLFNSIPNVYSPFTDHEVYDFLASLPASLFLDHQLHTDAIARAYPQYAHVPYEKKNYAVVNRRHYRRLALDVGRYYLAQRSTAIRESFLLPRLLKCAVGGDEAITWLAPLTIYLSQLESIARQ